MGMWGVDSRGRFEAGGVLLLDEAYAGEILKYAQVIKHIC